MKRYLEKKLLEWKNDKYRKPLLIRGARQVGKTYLVRQFAKQFENYVELNFELTFDARKIFDKDLDPVRIIRDLSLLTDQKIIPGKTLLFFDEIQGTPNAISALRYFYEKIPELHIIATGSLLDFALEELGLPVGRVNLLYLYPLSFLEFLEATDKNLLVEEILNHKPDAIMPLAIHDKLLNCLGIYIAIGGMPEAVRCWIETQDLQQCTKIHQELIDTYKQDFQKYAKRFQIKYLDLIFDKIPLFLGKRFKFSNISLDYRKRELLPCLELLAKANVAHQIYHSSGNGVPLGAEINVDKFKVIFLDIALSQRILGLDTKSWVLDSLQTIVNKGEIVEAFIGQELCAYGAPYQAQHLFYWTKESPSSNAELDYLIQSKSDIVPVEVKSGAQGRLKSMHLFLDSHSKSKKGYRFSVNNYAIEKNIHSYPLYAVAGALTH